MTTLTKLNLLRLFTAGSVDDGKSTLIGRLLYDSESLYQDQRSLIDATGEISPQSLAHLTDGLKAEREQGITIDVAYRYFHHNERRFILADTPGHIEYTRNMITAASTADIGLFVIDASRPLTDQTKRHAIISSLLTVPHLVVCINKMDLIHYDPKTFHRIKTLVQAFLKNLHFKTIHFIPISALKGDNIVTTGTNMPWYTDLPLLARLAAIKIINDPSPHGRFPIQYVIHHDPLAHENTPPTPHTPSTTASSPVSPSHPSTRRYAGQVASGTFTPNQHVTILPSGTTTTIHKIFVAETEVTEAVYPMSIAIELTDDLDVSRGSMIVPQAAQPPTVTTTFTARLCSLHTQPIQTHTSYLLKHGCRTVRTQLQNIISKLNIHSLVEEPAPQTLLPNDIATASLQTSQPIFIDAYPKNRHNGNFILIDPHTHATIAAGLCH